MNIFLIILIPLFLITFSVILHRKVIKKSRLFKEPQKADSLVAFKFLSNRAFSQFFKPQKTYLWTIEFSDLLEKMDFSEKTFSLFLNSLSEQDLKNYWEEYDLILYWHFSERKKITESYEDLNPELFIKEIDRLDAQINHKIISSFKHNPQLIIEIKNFMFYESLKHKKLIH